MTAPRLAPPLLLAAIAASALAATACGGGSDALSKETFIDVVVALRETERELRQDSLPEDSAVVLFNLRKAEILEEHRATEDQVRAFVNRTYADLELQTEVWETISERLKYLPPVDAGDPGDPARDDVGGGMIPPRLMDRTGIRQRRPPVTDSAPLTAPTPDSIP